LAQIRLAQHFAGLSTDEYERERTALTALIGRFCEDLSKEQCVARILGGRVIAGLQDDVLGYLRERELEQERRR
jgi:hypothetical protein